MPTANAAVALAADPSLAVTGQADQSGLWATYLTAANDAIQKAQTWRMMKSAAGASGQTGFLFQQAYEAQNAADQAYQAWQAAVRAANPGARG